VQRDPAHEGIFPDCCQGPGGGAPAASDTKLERMGLTSHLPSELWAKEEVFARSIAAKLWESNRYDLGQCIEQCRTRETICLCQGCHKHTVLMNHCDRFYCPMCTARLSYRRKLTLEWWAKEVPNPKHLVLTCRNRNSISKNYVKYFKTALQRLRRSELFRSVRGGLSSLEVTNEGKGWHLHSHLLLDSDFIPIDLIAQLWAKLIGQDFAIVKIKSVKDKSYLQEVTKYVVKGSELARWPGNQIAEFIDAMTGIRCFGTFGTLFKDRAKRARAKKELGKKQMECPNCANYDFWYLSPNEFEWYKETGKLPEYLHRN
jgi:hypothetical protein